MLSFSTLFSEKYLRFFSTRILLGLAIVLVYLIIWRPIRMAVTEYTVYPQVKSFETEAASFSSTLETGSLIVYYKYRENTKQLQYRPEFGFFFLIAVVVLLFVTGDMKPYLLLAALHLIGSVLAYLFLMAGTAGISTGFALSHAVSGYLTPALSLALVPLVIRGNIE